MEYWLDVLGLKLGATLDDVKEAHRRAVKEHHPDQYPRGSAEQSVAHERMVRANQAYDFLKAWFVEHPDGKPTADAPEPQAMDDGSWETWGKEQSRRFDDEVRAWKERQAASEHEKSTQRETLRRNKLVIAAPG